MNKGNTADKEKTIIFWRDVPMDVNLGAFEKFAELWQGSIIVVSNFDYPPERKQCGFSSLAHANVREIVLAEQEAPQRYAKEIIEENHAAIHIFNGIRQENEIYLNYLIKICKKVGERPLVGVIGERPNFIGNRLKLLFRKWAYFILYRFLAFKYSKYIRAFFAMGESGVKCYRKYGFSTDSLYPYMYCPKLSIILDKKIELHHPLRFLYIGRFNYSTKGLDLLMNAIENIEPKDWELDLVGGYGDKAQDVLQWCNKHEQIKYIGSWDNSKVCENMCNYDVCIVPSRYDGWNLTPNQAINAGIGTIITTEAGSNDLIKYSHSGIVVETNINSLKEAILYAVRNPEEIIEWKKRTQAYNSLVSGKSVGKYFYNVIQFSFFNRGMKPQCPWRG